MMFLGLSFTTQTTDDTRETTDDTPHVQQLHHPYTYVISS